MYYVQVFGPLTRSRKIPTVADMAQELAGTQGTSDSRTPFHEDDWERVGETLRTIRELRGLKQPQLAEEVGVSRAYWVNIECGRKKLTNVLLAKAAAALGVTQMAIMRPDLEPTDPPQ